jgi:opacity protein-like surface antigen
MMALELAGGPIMTTSKSFLVSLAALAMSVSAAAPVGAADWSYKVLDPPERYDTDFGLRFWFGQGHTAKNLFGTDGSLVSRLTYSGYAISTGEAFTRFDFNNGWFVKGYAGAGGFWGGKLKDEDFPPGIDPYSATLSTQKFGSLAYLSADTGFNLVRGPDFRVGAFIGYHFLRETLSAYGCGQIATNPDVCGGGIPDFVKGITQVNNWHSLRVGFDAAVEVASRVKLSVDAAWLPYVNFSGADAHWLRIDPFAFGAFNGPIPEDGSGWGYQLDAFLSYRVSDMISIGLGARYWHMETNGFSHFEGHVVGFNASPQPLHWKVDNVGAIMQATWKLGPYPIISSN